MLPTKWKPVSPLNPSGNKLSFFESLIVGKGNYFKLCWTKMGSYAWNPLWQIVWVAKNYLSTPLRRFIVLFSYNSTGVIDYISFYNSTWEIDHSLFLFMKVIRSRIKNLHHGTKKAQRILSCSRVVGADELLLWGLAPKSACIVSLMAVSGVWGSIQKLRRNVASNKIDFQNFAVICFQLR